MRPGVISDQMAGLGNSLHEFRLCFCLRADQKKSCTHAMAGENVQEFRSPGGIWPVVEGERNLARARRRSEGAAKKPGTRPHGSIGVDACRDAGARGHAQPCINRGRDWRDHSYLSVCVPHSILRRSAYWQLARVFGNESA